MRKGMRRFSRLGFQRSTNKKMNTKKIKQTVCTAGLAAIVAVSAGCRASKLSLLSDRDIIPPPFKSPQLTQTAPEPAIREIPAIPMTSTAVIPAGNEQPSLPGEGGSPIFVQAGPQDITVSQQHFDTPEDVSPKTADEPKKSTPAKPAPQQPKRTYTVVKGDTLSDIAYMYMISWRDLAAENNLTEKSVLKVNQKLVLPSNAAEKPRARQQRKAVPSKSASKGTAPAAGASKAPASTPAAAKLPLPPDGIYTIVPGDNLWVIAKRFGLKSEDIRAANPDVNFDNLQINQKIKLPVASAKPGSAAPAKADPKKAPKPIDATVVPPMPPAPVEPPQANAVVPEPVQPPMPVPAPAPAPGVVPAPAPAPQPVPLVPATPEIPGLAPQPVTPQPQATPLVPAN